VARLRGGKVPQGVCAPLVALNWKGAEGSGGVAETAAGGGGDRWGTGFRLSGTVKKWSKSFLEEWRCSGWAQLEVGKAGEGLPTVSQERWRWRSAAVELRSGLEGDRGVGSTSEGRDGFLGGSRGQGAAVGGCPR
jgi:hypothetical protein